MPDESPQAHTRIQASYTTECRNCGEDHLRPQDLSPRDFCRRCQTEWPHDCDDCFEMGDGTPCRKHDHLYEPDNDARAKDGAR